MSPILRRFRSFGGFRLVKRYAQMGVLGTALWEALLMVLGRKSTDAAYTVLQRKVSTILCERYDALVDERKAFYDQMEREGRLRHENSGKIWICWLQGMEQAPEMVRMCLQSVRTNIKEREVVVLSEKNCGEYVSFPEDFLEKYHRGLIPPALFSDMLRLELLIRYGGTWMDATVLCARHDFPANVLDCDLFLFQERRKGDTRFLGVSNWMITACSENRLLMVLRDVLYQYWRDEDCTLQYYIFRLIFGMIAKRYPDEVAAMPKGNRWHALRLGRHLADDYNEEWLEKVLHGCCFQKMNYRKEEAARRNPNSVYYELLRRFGVASDAE